MCKYKKPPLGAGPIAGIVIACVVLLLVTVALVLWHRKRSHYKGLPLHEAVANNRPLTMEMLAEHAEVSKSLDRDGCSVLDLVLAQLGSYSVDEDVLYELAVNSMPCDEVTGAMIQEEADHQFGWAKLIQQSDDVVVAVVLRILDTFEAHVEILAYEAKDVRGRRCVDIASPECRDAILRATYLDHRFELKQGAAEHKSATSVVIFATDHSAQGAKVALKFMQHRDQYLAETVSRAHANFDGAFVVAVLQSFDGDSDEAENAAFHQSAVRRGFAKYPYCVVMDIADTNLQRVILQQHVAGCEWDVIKLYMKGLCSCLAHVHSKQLIHGDLKPLNVVLMNNSVRLIDLDASVSFSADNHQFIGSKYSSLYLAPEVFYELPDGRQGVRTYQRSSDTGMPVDEPREYELVRASPAQDMWSLGVIMYLLCTGRTLFQASVEDNLGPEEMKKLLAWDDAMMVEKLSLVTDDYARNLLSLLLDRDPSRRLRPDQVIDHPFISGVQTERLQGEPAAWDVFLSYRVDSDSHLVELFYNALTDLGLKVWWDKVCLLPGVPWEEGFCNGLADSSCFVCLLSRNAINHPDKPWQNFTHLEPSSRCDNVLLEWRLALELWERKMIEGVFPVFIGDVKSGSGKEIEYSDYFASGCHPSPVPNNAVDSVESKLRDHLRKHGLGAPLKARMSVADVVGQVLACQGGFLRGHQDDSIASISKTIADMRSQRLISHRRPPRSPLWSPNRVLDDGVIGTSSPLSERLSPNVAVFALENELSDVQEIIDKLRADHRKAMQELRASKDTEITDANEKLTTYRNSTDTIIESCHAEIARLQSLLTESMTPSTARATA